MHRATGRAFACSWSELMQIMQDVSGETMFELCGTSIGYAVSMVTMFAFNELGRRAVTKQSESETK